MDEAKTRPGFPGDRSQAAAEKLRALRQRANQALDDHRVRLTQIESELSQRIHQLTDEFDNASAKGARPSDPARDEELAALRRQLDDGRAKHEKFVEQLTVARRQLDSIQAQPCASCHDAAQQLADAQGEIRRLRDEVDAAEARRQEEHARHEKLAEQIAEARRAISDLQSDSAEQTAQLQADLDAARQANAALEDKLAAVERDAAAADHESESLAARAASMERELAAATAQQAALTEQLEKIRTDLEESARHAAELKLANQSLAAELAAGKLAADGDQRELAEQLSAARNELFVANERAAAAHVLTAGAEQRLADAQALAAGADVRLEAAEQQVADAHTRVAAAERRAAALDDEIAAASRRAGEAEQCAAQAEGRAATAQQHAAEALERAAAAELNRASADAANAESKAVAGVLQAEVDELRRQLAAAQDDAAAAAELPALRAACEQFQSDAESGRAETESCRQEIAAIAGALDAAQQELAELKTSAAAPTDLAERGELQRKFDLALADVQKLKREVSELRDELSRRPEASDQESPELIAVRSERDALINRIAELEATPPAATGADAQRDLDDLHRRFEMAVDDVRQLKQENSQLRDKVAASKSPTSAATPGGSNDWAAQRARLMAVLEEEDGASASIPERRKERASIENTIALTDRIVAEKEEELANLRAACEAAAKEPAPEPVNPHAAALDADEVIAAQRQRLAALEEQWEAKLRSAELEFSVERAKLARDQAAIRDQLSTLRAPSAPAAADGSDGKPRRRWLSALGLGEEGEEKK